MKKGYIGVATNRALSVAHCAQKKKKREKKKNKKKSGPFYTKCAQYGPLLQIILKHVFGPQFEEL